MMISNRALAVGCCRLFSVTLETNFPHNGLLLQSRRHIKSVRKVFRTKLKPYKLDLGQLPPLTGLLTSATEAKEEPGSHALQSLNDLWSHKMEVYKAFLPVNQKPVLLEALFNPQNDIDTLLRVIDENLISMTSFYVATSFEALDDMMRHGQCDISTVAVSPELKRLCARTLYKIRFFEADEVLKLLKCLATIRLPEEVLLSQAAFQMARHLINDFNLNELRTLSDCLNAFTITDNSKKSLLLALKDAIPTAMANQIEEGQYEKPRHLEADKSLQGKAS